MIENQNEASRNLEKALQALEQAKQRVANEKKKQNEKKRKSENHHKYIMGGIIVKYFPDCYQYDEDELKRFIRFRSLGEDFTEENLKKALQKNPDALAGMEGIHFHTLCEQNSDDLEKTLNVVEQKFGFLLQSDSIKWVNFGGGHHITRDDYDIKRLEKCINHVKKTYNVDVYVEPGEAVALNAGYLVTTVLDKVENGITTLILDASAACHMPDVLEMPYVPPLRDAVKLDDINADIWEKPADGRFRYRLSSYTCLAGDITGDYEFDSEVNAGDRLVFEDMAIYSMVKNNTFNGIPLPDIAIMDVNGDCRLWKHFDYDEFKRRL